MADDAVTVVELGLLDAERAQQVVDCLASWHAAEWGHLYHPEVWNLHVAREEFTDQFRSGGGRAPTTYVAFDAAHRLVGSVSLALTDDLAGFDHLSPWLASLYVTPAWRRRGVGRRLIAHLLDQPPARHAGRVYLFTADHQSWYTELGWQTIATATSGPHAHPVTVMTIRATEDAGSAPLPHPTA